MGQTDSSLPNPEAFAVGHHAVGQQRKARQSGHGWHRVALDLVVVGGNDKGVGSETCHIDVAVAVFGHVVEYLAALRKKRFHRHGHQSLALDGVGIEIVHGGCPQQPLAPVYAKVYYLLLSFRSEGGRLER